MRFPSELRRELLFWLIFDPIAPVTLFLRSYASFKVELSLDELIADERRAETLLGAWFDNAVPPPDRRDGLCPLIFEPCATLICPGIFKWESSPTIYPNFESFLVALKVWTLFKSIGSVTTSSYSLKLEVESFVFSLVLLVLLTRLDLLSFVLGFAFGFSLAPLPSRGVSDCDSRELEVGPYNPDYVINSLSEWRDSTAESFRIVSLFFKFAILGTSG